MFIQGPTNSTNAELSEASKAQQIHKATLEGPTLLANERFIKQSLSNSEAMLWDAQPARSSNMEAQNTARGPCAASTARG